MLYVVGHKSPDTDSVASAIAYAHLKNELGEEAKAFRLGEINNETKFVLEKFGVEVPEIIESLADKDVVLVDHNEFTQNVEDINKANIKEVIDHHKLKFSYDKPIYVLTMPLGSTATIVSNLYFWSEIEIPKDIAGLLLSAILSDTVIFKSPTTTEEDREIGEKLSKICGIDNVEEYGIELFKRKSDIMSKSVEELLYNDYKISEFGDKKIMVSQLEVIDDKEILSKKKEILEKMKEIRKDKGLYGVLLMITDIMKEGSTLLVDSDNISDFEKAYGVKFEENSVWVKGMMSRKKQVLPPLYDALG